MARGLVLVPALRCGWKADRISCSLHKPGKSPAKLTVFGFVKQFGDVKCGIFHYRSKPDSKSRSDLSSQPKLIGTTGAQTAGTSQRGASWIFPIFGRISQADAYPTHIRRHSASSTEELCWEFSFWGVPRGSSWLQPGWRYCGKGRSQIQVQFCHHHPSKHRIWERTTCAPVDFMLDKHIHEIRLPESHEEN